MPSRKAWTTNYPDCVCIYALYVWCVCVLPLCDVGGEVSLHRKLNVLFCSWQRHGTTATVNPTVIWLTSIENNTSSGSPAELMTSAYPPLRAWVAPLCDLSKMPTVLLVLARHPLIELQEHLLHFILTPRDFLSSVDLMFYPGARIASNIRVHPGNSYGGVLYCL